MNVARVIVHEPAGPIGSFRRGVPRDAAALAAFAARTFRETFGHSASAADLDAHEAAAYGTAQQERELVDPDTITILIEHEGTLLGFAQVRRASPPACAAITGAIELHRFYVDRPWHGRGLAPRLMSEVRRAARELGGSAIWLGVWEHNARAIAFYRKSGYEDRGSTDYWVGPDRQTDRVMVAVLGSGE